MSVKTGGSSPLARGLREVRTIARRDDGIIPARAGFTPRGPDEPRPPQDHPRSRGVYGTRSAGPLGLCGSSPLARGLLLREGDYLVLNRIIPARAGFTV